MLICTTPSVANRPVVKVLGLVASEVIFGANFLRDWAADISDVAGGRVATLEKLYGQARAKALAELREQAGIMRAEAIVSVRFEYQVLGKDNGMVMVAAHGTAVALGVDAEVARKREEHERRERAGWYVQVEGKRQGPFSVLQLSQLVYDGKLELEAVVTDEGGQSSTIDALMQHDPV